MQNAEQTLTAEEPGWHGGSATQAGSLHDSDGVPCQDAAMAQVGRHSFVIVCDGRGSSPSSHWGARAAMTAFSQTLEILSPLLMKILDSPFLGDASTREAAWHDLADVLIRALSQSQRQEAEKRGVDPTTMEYTLAAAVVGKEAIGAVQVGDSCLAIETKDEVRVAFPPQTGDCINETNFVQPRDGATQNVCAGLFPAAGVVGLAAITDGVTSKWVHQSSCAPAPAIGQVLGKLRSGEWDQTRLSEYLSRPLWLKGGDDDRGVAYLVRADAGSPNKGDPNPADDSARKDSPAAAKASHTDPGSTAKAALIQR